MMKVVGSFQTAPSYSSKASPLRFIPTASLNVFNSYSQTVVVVQTQHSKIVSVHASGVKVVGVVVLCRERQK